MPSQRIHPARTLFSPRRTPVQLACMSLGLCALLALGACSSVNDVLGDSKVDYRSGSTLQPTTLEVPPDLTQLNSQSHYQGVPASGTVTASGFAAAIAAPAAASGADAAVAADRVGSVQLMRDGNIRWLHTTQSAQEVWPKIRAFWQQHGFTLDVDKPELGIMQTNWLENRANLPQDIIRRTLGSVFDSLYDTGERDMYRTRVERSSDGGTDIYIAQQGMQEVVDNARNGSTVWQPRPNDPMLEADMLSRLMVQLGATKEAAQAAKAQAAKPTAPSAQDARVLSDAKSTAVQIDAPLDVAWRRVGLALDRNSFTVEDRDRGQNTYYVRYVDQAMAENSPGFFARLFGAKDRSADSLGRYRLVLSETNGTTTVAVLNHEGDPATSASARKIAKLLADDINQ